MNSITTTKNVLIFLIWFFSFFLSFFTFIFYFIRNRSAYFLLLSQSVSAISITLKPFFGSVSRTSGPLLEFFVIFVCVSQCVSFRIKNNRCTLTTHIDLIMALLFIICISYIIIFLNHSIENLTLKHLLLLLLSFYSISIQSLFDSSFFVLFVALFLKPSLVVHITQ